MKNSNDYIQAAREVLAIEKDAIQRVSDHLDQNFSQAVEVLHKSLRDHGKIMIVGIGKSGNIGHKIAATFNSTGSTSVVLNSQNALHGDLGVICDGDVVIAMSYSGETAELLHLIPHLRRFDITMIALTGKLESSLARLSDYALDCGVEREACPMNLAPTSSSTAMLALGDALAMVLLQARGVTSDDFSRFHPGGSLGQALTTMVDDIMRDESGMVVLTEESTVEQALKEMSSHKAGASVVVGADKKVLGIFTHGDFVRAFQAQPDLNTRRVKDFMTVNPINIKSGELAVKALEVLQAKRIDDIIVVNEQSEPIGMIDSQDLARHKLI